MTVAAGQASGAQMAQWSQLLAQYREPRPARSAAEIAVTAFPFAALWLGAWLSFHYGFWPGVLLVVPAAGFLVRLFLIQHDCSHGAFFRTRRLNDWVGRVISVVTLTPYDHWRWSHAVHHAGVGNLDRRGIGDVYTLTVREYSALGRWRRLGYRIYRHPLFLFGIAPAYLFLLQHRLPTGMMRDGWQPWFGTMATNAAIFSAGGMIAWATGIVAFLVIQLPIVILAASIGVWLFYVQHQFEQTFWDGEGAWNHPEASLHGSSYYDLPPPLGWFTANIGIHHVHHLNSRIPFYRLPEVLRKYPELKTIGRLTLLTSFRCVGLALWDQNLRRLVSFREMRRIRPAAAVPSE
jgi:omega-6 fatty acid desaturase (delta-12 desaturase)